MWGALWTQGETLKIHKVRVSEHLQCRPKQTDHRLTGPSLVVGSKGCQRPTEECTPGLEAQLSAFAAEGRALEFGSPKPTRQIQQTPEIPACERQTQRVPGANWLELAIHMEHMVYRYAHI